MQPYISDEHYFSPDDRDRAIATHLRELARKLNGAADRYLLERREYGSLAGSDVGIVMHEDIAIQNTLVDYINRNHKKIGDISMAWGVLQLVRAGSQVYRKVEEKV